MRLLALNHGIFAEEQIEFLLLQFEEPGDDIQAYNKKIIETFISSVYLYDDKLLVYYNIKDGEELSSSDISLLEAGKEFEQESVISTRRRRHL